MLYILLLVIFLNITICSAIIIIIQYIYILQVNQLESIGGHDLKDTVRRTMSRLLSHQLSLRFNWTGKTGWKKKEHNLRKRAFGGLYLATAAISMYKY